MKKSILIMFISIFSLLLIGCDKNNEDIQDKNNLSPENIESTSDSLVYKKNGNKLSISTNMFGADDLIEVVYSGENEINKVLFYEDGYLVLDTTTPYSDMKEIEGEFMNGVIGYNDMMYELTSLCNYYVGECVNKDRYINISGVLNVVEKCTLYRDIAEFVGDYNGDSSLKNITIKTIDAGIEYGKIMKQMLEIEESWTDDERSNLSNKLQEATDKYSKLLYDGIDIQSKFGRTYRIDLLDSTYYEDRYQLDFSNYEYLGHDDIWDLNEYYTGNKDKNGMLDGKVTVYYENGQIAEEGYYEHGLMQGVFTGYFPAYGNYLYYISGDNIIEQYIEKIEDSGIEKKPSGWLYYTKTYENGVENGLYTEYLSQKDVRTNENIIHYTAYIENGKEIWIEIGGKKYTNEEINKMSNEKFDELFKSPDIEEGYYYLIGKKATLQGGELTNYDTSYKILDSLDDWKDDGEAKMYISEPIWSGDELVQNGEMIYRYPNGNMEKYYNYLGFDENDTMILNDRHVEYYENGQVSSIARYSYGEQLGLYVKFDENREIEKLKYYIDSNNVIDLTKNQKSLDALGYYDALGNNFYNCIEELIVLPEGLEKGKEDVFLKEYQKVRNICVNSLEIFDIIGDYKGDSKLVDAYKEHLSGEIKRYDLKVDVIESGKKGSRAETMTKYTTQFNRQEKSLDELFNTWDEFEAKYF